MSLLDRLKTLDPVIVTLTIGLTIFGLAMLMSASGPVAFSRTGDSLFYVKRQLLTGVLPGSVLFLILSLIDYRRWKPFAFAALIVTFVLLLAVYIPGIGLSVGGSRSWIHLGLLRFQPSELVKLTFLVYVAAWLTTWKTKTESNGMLPFLVTLGAVVFLLVKQPDTGSMAVIVGSSILLFLAAGASIFLFSGLCLTGAGMIALLVRSSPYRAARFTTFLHPELDPKGIGYQINQAILAIGSGGWFGLGFGHSRQKFLYLPEVESDSIIAVMAEELGLIVLCLFFLAMGWLVWRCFTIARQSRDPFGSYLAIGIGSWIGIQFILNVASMCGLMPITGVTLPFVSHGGSAMTVLLGAMGLVAGIGRTSSSHTRL